MSYRLGQHLSEQHAQDDPLKDRIWLALQFLVSVASLFIAVGFLGDWGPKSLLVGAGILLLGSSLLYLLLVRGRRKR
jgi:hypothetical protein